MQGLSRSLRRATGRCCPRARSLLVLLVISFRSRSTVFCQYLKTMTGIALKPADVTRAFKSGRQGRRARALPRPDHPRGPEGGPGGDPRCRRDQRKLAGEERAPHLVTDAALGLSSRAKRGIPRALRVAS